MKLILTLDYELLGFGSGDVFKHMIEPTDKLLAICDKDDIKITIFFEVLEYLKIKEEWNSGNTMGYSKNPAEAIEKQIKEAYRNGHDIQLHLHPQWINAEYNDGWKVDNDYWRLPEVQKDNCAWSIEELLQMGKSKIEEIVKIIDPNYNCNIFRAGGYNVCPSAEICEAMRKTGFIADSSVIPGAYLDDGLSYYDFRASSVDQPFWIVNGDNLQNHSNEYIKGKSIIEIPVFSLPIKRIRKYDLQRMKNKLENRKHSIIQMRRKTGDRNIFEKIKYYLEQEVVTWDFSLFSYGKMKKFYKKAVKINSESQYNFHPFVIIGHSKELSYTKVLERFLRYANIDNVIFVTLSNCLETIRNG